MKTVPDAQFFWFHGIAKVFGSASDIYSFSCNLFSHQKHITHFTHWNIPVGKWCFLTTQNAYFVKTPLNTFRVLESLFFECMSMYYHCFLLFIIVLLLYEGSGEKDVEKNKEKQEMKKNCGRQDSNLRKH